MASSLFPSTSTVGGSGQSYVTTTSETPTWMQDAIYNQIQLAQNVANTPYQNYSLPQVAELTPYQQQAYSQVQQQQGNWKPGVTAAQQGISSMAGNNYGADAAGQYYDQINSGAPLSQAGQYWQPAGALSGVDAAMPYMQNASQSSVSNIDQYMNPYTQNVTDQIAKLGARNLSENLLPNVSDAFVKAGQFGGTRMGEFGSRALRDTQESILNQQSQALQQGYGQALNASNTDLARQAQLGSTLGSLTGQQQQNLTTLGSSAGSLSQQQQALLGNLGSQAGSLAQTDASRNQALYQQQAALAQQQQQMGLADASALESAGASQQTNEQQQLTAAYNSWLAEQNYPKTQLDWLNQQVRGMSSSVPQTQYQASSQNYNQSPLAQIATGLSAGAGIYNLLTGK